MSVVAFLAGVVGSGVAAEAAKTALQELTDGDTARIDEDEKKSSEEKIDDDDVLMDEDDKEDSLSALPAATKSNSGTPAPIPSDSAQTKKKHTLPHSKVVRAAELALKSSAKAAQTLATAEDTQIRSALASLIKLTLTKLELKMSQFEELEDLLEEERKSLEAARMGLVNERVGLKRMLDAVRLEIAKNGGVGGAGGVGAAVMMASNSGLGTTGQGSVVMEVGNGSLQSDVGPVADGSMLQLS
jgi:SWI/SNF related-matrix-associated actin-dependent regulator of chromatin subfamily C